jgi:hypothetical protein
LEEYLKAVPSLTINDDSRILSKQLYELQQSSKDESQMIVAKFAEKEKEIAELNQKVKKLDSDQNSWVDVITIAKKIARDENGMFDEAKSILDADRKFTISYRDMHNQTKTMRIPIDLVEVLDGDAKQYIKWAD